MATTQFIVEDAVNGFVVTPKETGKSGKYWTVTLPHLLGSDPVNGGGLLFLMESMSGTEKTSQISVQWNETFNSCRLSMVGIDQYLDLQLSSLGASRVPISVVTPKTTSVGVLDLQQGSSEDFPGINRELMKLITDDFSEVLGAFGDHLNLPNAPPNSGGATVIFQTNTGGGSGDDCDKKRTGGWLIAGLELAAALAVGAAAVATGGLAGIAAGLGAAAAAAKGGKDAAETENQHKKCKEPA